MSTGHAPLKTVTAGPVIQTEEVLSALERLDAVGGSGVREEVLDALFSRFCIGK